MSVLIINVTGREILDSRGNPTVEAQVKVQNSQGKISAGRASVPSGASTGSYEAFELRDGASRYGGLGVLKAVEHINTTIRSALVGKNAENQKRVDEILLKLDGTDKKEHLGANAILAVSMAAARAVAASYQMPLYRYIGGVSSTRMPVPMMNILNGGAHAANSVDIQEFMIVPKGAPDFKEGLRWCSEVYHALERILKKRKLSTAVGDEGGFAPELSDEREVLEIILEAITAAGYTYGEENDFMLALDAAASEWQIGDKYKLPKSKTVYTTETLISHWKQLVEEYPIFSIEDPLGEEDWEGWKQLTAQLGQSVLLIGDDLFVTNTKRLEKGIRMECANGILIKPNQIGTLSETILAVHTAKQEGIRTILSHRSGETEDVTIADLAVALNMGFIKTGAPCRGERTAKYNRLLRIEEQILGK